MLPVPRNNNNTKSMTLFVHRSDGHAMLMSLDKGETAGYGSHCLGDMTVRMGQVLARPRVGVCASLAVRFVS